MIKNTYSITTNLSRGVDMLVMSIPVSNIMKQLCTLQDSEHGS